VRREANVVVPAPVRTSLRPGEPFLFDATVGLEVGHPSLNEVADGFRDDIGVECGIRLQPARTGANRSISLQLGAAPEGVGSPDDWMNPGGGSRADEWYLLVIETNTIRVLATGQQGAHRALATLRQLISAHRIGDTSALVPSEIEDIPRFGWRGLTVDLGRTFLSVADLKAVIDTLALYKLNVLHLHLNDYDGWRLQIDGWPRLTTEPGTYLTQPDYEELVAYAAARFVTVVPEIDFPGHTRSVLEAYPELGTLLPSGFGWLEPTEKTFAFVREVVAQVSSLTPGSYLHLGADEPFGMPTDSYIQFLRTALSSGSLTGKRVIGWQEASRAESDSLDAIQYWIDRDFGVASAGDPGYEAVTTEMVEMMKESFADAPRDLERAIARGARIILSPTRHTYLDIPYGEDPADDQRADWERLGLRVHAPQDTRAFANWDVTSGLPAGSLALVGGIEAAIWGETTQTLADVYFLLLPRLLGVAESAWSPSKAEWDEYRGRVSVQERIWRARGWNFFRSSQLSS
jgi:hexosaminidase